MHQFEKMAHRRYNLSYYYNFFIIWLYCAMNVIGMKAYVSSDCQFYVWTIYRKTYCTTNRTVCRPLKTTLFIMLLKKSSQKSLAPVINFTFRIKHYLLLTAILGKFKCKAIYQWNQLKLVCGYYFFSSNWAKTAHNYVPINKLYNYI